MRETNSPCRSRVCNTIMTSSNSIVPRKASGNLKYFQLNVTLAFALKIVRIDSQAVFVHKVIGLEQVAAIKDYSLNNDAKYHHEQLQDKAGAKKC